MQNTCIRRLFARSYAHTLHTLENNHIITNKFEFIGVEGKTSLHIRIMDLEYFSHKYNYNMFHIRVCQYCMYMYPKRTHACVCVCPSPAHSVYVLCGCRHVDSIPCWFSHFSVSSSVAHTYYIYPNAKSLNLNTTQSGRYGCSPNAEHTHALTHADTSLTTLNTME